jgi:hypothetical protein
MRRALSVAVLAVLAACDEQPGYDAGYSDGYAATINTASGFRSTLIHGEWDSKEYSHGYSMGSNEASMDIANLGCDRLK